MNSLVASKSSGILNASSRQIGCSGKPDERSKQNSNPDAASSSQGWHKDALLDVCTGKHVAPGYEGYPGNSGIPGNSGDSETEGIIWPHNFNVSPDCVLHMEKVFSIKRRTYGRSPTDDLNDLDVNTALWVMSVTLQAAVHLGPRLYEKSASTKNQPQSL